MMRRNIVFAIVFCTICTGFTEAAIIKSQQKRAIFREQLTPELGGKIPSSAFRTDRLLLNRLQKEGIAIPDGIILEQRTHQVYPHVHRIMRPTYQVKINSGGHYITMPFADTTYVVKQIWDKRPIVVPPFKPLIAYLEFPTTGGEQPKTLPIHVPHKPPTDQFLNNGGHASYYKGPTYHSHVVTAWPPKQSITWASNYLTAQAHNDLDTFFTKWGPRVLRDTKNQQQQQELQVPK